MIGFTRRGASALLAATGFALLMGGLNPLAAQELESLKILAPSSAGSGYDQLSRAIQTVLQQDGLAASVEVENVAGGGGTVGLAQFVTSRPRDASSLTIGFALVGGVLTTKSAVTLEQTVPIARLMGESNAIVVPANSDIKTLDDLVAKLKQNAGAVSWAGGSIGGVDHITAGLFAKTIGVDPTTINYVVHAGGGEVLASVLGGHATVGISGFEEFRAQVEAGELVALAVSGDDRIPGVDVPTMKEAGVDLAIMNWRGIVAHPRMSEDQVAALEAAIAAMVKTPEWRAVLEERGWTDTYLPAAEFKEFLGTEQTRIEAALREVGLI